MKPAQLLRQLTDKLLPVYDADEANAIARLLLRECLFVDRAKLMINDELDIGESKHLFIEKALYRLLDHEPVQHILGYAYFYDRRFKVSPDVLVPRPETEELVDLVISRHKGSRSGILDIGTGSGCIPVTLKCEMPGCALSGIDISEKALAIAEQNAIIHNAEVRFHQCDILAEIPEGVFDVIISNPPYITESEKVRMEKNVLVYEPGTALFVPDDDPLRFYRRIAQISTETLHSGGMLYFEINESYGPETAQLLEEADFKNIEIIRDLNGKDRIVCGKKL